MRLIHVLGGIRNYLILISEGVNSRNYSVCFNLNKAKNNFDPRAPSNCKSLILSTDYNWVHSIDKFNFAKFTVKGGLKSF